MASHPGFMRVTDITVKGGSLGWDLSALFLHPTLCTGKKKIGRIKYLQSIFLQISTFNNTYFIPYKADTVLCIFKSEHWKKINS
jgi:hypothetical protein